MTTEKIHQDGGTYSTIAFSPTRDGWGVSITRWTTYQGKVVFEVNRVGSDNRTMRVAKCRTESEARIEANKTWRKDR